MTLKQLTTFFWVCRLGGFAAAAARLNSTQSTVSMRIQELEASLGVLLIDRSPRSVRPTPKGTELLADVERLLTLAAEIEKRVADPQILSGTVRLGVSELVAVTWLSDLIAETGRRYPKVVFEPVVDLSQAQLRKVLGGELDIALIPGPASGLTNVPLGTVDFAWMASPKLGLGGRPLSAADLSAFPMLGLPQQSKLHGFVRQWFEASGVAVPPSRFCNSTNVVAVLTAAGLGTSYLPGGSLTDKLVADGSLEILETSPPFPPFGYYAVFDARSPLPLAPVIADLAGRLSTFRKTEPAVAAP